MNFLTIGFANLACEIGLAPADYARLMPLMRHAQPQPGAEVVLRYVWPAQPVPNHPARQTLTLSPGDDLLTLAVQTCLAPLIAAQKTHLALHAGVVAHPKGAVIVVGATFSGKSTLTAQLLRAGLAYLSDELAVVSLTNQAVYGWGRPIILRPASQALFAPQIAAAADGMVLPHHGDLLVAPAVLGTIATQPQTPALIVFPKFQPGADLTLTELTPAQASLELMQLLANARNLPNHGLPAVAALSQSVPAIQLHYGDSAQAAAAISDYFND